MSLRIVPTPLPAPLSWPSPRDGGLRPELLEAFITPESSGAARLRLQHPDALVVTTGQQPGLLTGPLYTIYKALSAVAVARLCEARWRRPVTPVFWAAGGDHDFAEGNHASWPGSDGTTVTMTLRERAPDAPLTPLYREPVGPEIQAVLARLEADLPPSEFRESVLQLFRRWYQPERNLAESCAHTLAELLAPFGVVIFDATHPAVKRAQMPYLLAALERSGQLDRMLVQRHTALLTAGSDPGVTVGDDATLVMYEGQAGRDRLVARSPDFETRRSGERFSLAGLQQLALRVPERFSPNVLLRPVVEAALLPTVAYMAGPGELRYLALVEPLYQALHLTRQLPLPRWSGVLVDARVDRVLAKFEAGLEELLLPGQRLEARVLRNQLPTDVTSALGRLREAITTNYEILIEAARAIDPTIERTIRNLGHQAAVGTRDVEARLVGHLKKRHVTETQQIARARELVLPLGKPQERVHTIAPWLARYGPSLLRDLAESVEGWYRAGLEAPPQPA